MRRCKLIFLLLMLICFALGYFRYVKSHLQVFAKTPKLEGEALYYTSQKHHTAHKISLTAAVTKITSKSNISLASYYCNSPDVQNRELDTSLEGQGEIGWSLQQVQVVIRHGDRAPLDFELYNKFHTRPQSCNVYAASSKYVALKFFTQSILEDLKWTSQQAGHTRFLMPPIPHSIRCAPGQLSSFGLVQHLALGAHLKRVYSKWQGFLSNIYNNIVVQSTRVKRTYQSAIAFLFGFLPDLHLHKVKIIINDSSKFCGTKCSCPVAGRYKLLVDKLYYKVYWQRQKHNTTIERIAKLLGYSDHTGSLIDSLVAGYQCKQLSLPCKTNGECVTQSDLEILMKEHEYMNREIAMSSASRNHSLLVMHPMLETIMQQMQAVLTKSDRARKFILYSAHDTTLRPLLQALQIPEYRWPQFASRLVFELWKGPENQSYLKLLYNGKDITHNTGFSNERKCPLERFQTYVERDIATLLGSKSLDDACNKQSSSV